MKEKPILFNAEMVGAILAGQKTQTRRPMKMQPDHHWDIFPDYKVSCPVKQCQKGSFARFYHSIKSNNSKDERTELCPFGWEGYQLYVRETWGIGTRPCPMNGWYDGIEYRADELWTDPKDGYLPCYKIEDGIDYEKYQEKNGWWPSIHMPRWASRINLKVKRVWGERIQDIAYLDCLAEGTPDRTYHVDDHWPNESSVGEVKIWEFSELWKSCGYDWDSNPWVWACEFEVMK